MNCKYYNKCGSCNYKLDDYNKYIKEKELNLSRLFSKKVIFHSVMENPYNYRYKVQATFSSDKNNKIISGLYEKNSHKLFEIDECHIENKSLREIIEKVTLILRKYKYKAYDEDKKTGIFRHIQLRKGFNSREIMLVLITYSEFLPGSRKLIKEIKKQCPNITTIIQNINERDTNAVLGYKNKTLYGPGFIFDKIKDTMFKISPNAFYQINPYMAEKLYDRAIELINLNKGEILIDSYCGTGTIGILASKYAKRVIGIDNSNSISDAKYNARKNKINNIIFYKEDATEFLEMVADKKELAHALIMDPSREGSTRRFINSIIRMKINKVMYISCNPDTLKRDLNYFTKDYKVEKIEAFDMFPFTEHVECLVLLSLKT